MKTRVFTAALTIIPWAAWATVYAPPPMWPKTVAWSCQMRDASGKDFALSGKLLGRVKAEGGKKIYAEEAEIVSTSAVGLVGTYLVVRGSDPGIYKLYTDYPGGGVYHLTLELGYSSVGDGTLTIRRPVASGGSVYQFSAVGFCKYDQSFS